MTELNDLDCKVYLEPNQSLEELSEFMGLALSAPAGVARRRVLIQVPSGELEIRVNPDWQADRAAEFPDGFLFFRYVVEYYPLAQIKREERVSFVASLLQLFWKQHWAAIAACDYEDALPHKGGYGNVSLPWPSTNGAIQTNGVGSASPAEPGPSKSR